MKWFWNQSRKQSASIHPLSVTLNLQPAGPPSVHLSRKFFAAYTMYGGSIVPSAEQQPLTVIWSLPEPPITLKSCRTPFWHKTFDFEASRGNPVSSTLNILEESFKMPFASQTSRKSLKKSSKISLLVIALTLVFFSCSGFLCDKFGCLASKSCIQSSPGQPPLKISSPFSFTNSPTSSLISCLVNPNPQLARS